MSSNAETAQAQDAPAKPTRLAPIVTPDAKFFWDAADRGEFVGQRCGDCGHYRFPPRPMCPQCNSLNTEIVNLSGRGSVCSWIRPLHPMPFGFQSPPIVATIDLKEGTRMVSNLVDVAFGDIRAGMPVEVCFADTMGNHKVPVFRPVGG
ncbi:MAG: Zn-ribbon domain-containing OB-fold protein [Gammaproteobacteria bacterium]|nr:Zn-ribbon domain-containing OB-fold protein [Gammaproteobacteria bacterium]